jgi:hypothetical protein
MKLDVKALALTAGIIWGAAMLLVGLANLIWPAYGAAFLQIMGSVYPGYEAAPTIDSLILGTLYGFLDGAIAGLLFAWLYNVFVGRPVQRTNHSADLEEHTSEG